MRGFDHIDLRVKNLAEVRSFYEILLPALGFTKDAKIDGWIQYEVVAAPLAISHGQVTQPMNAGLRSGHRVWLR